MEEAKTLESYHILEEAKEEQRKSKASSRTKEKEMGTKHCQRIPERKY